MKVLGILAGPRKGRATDSVINAVLEGAKDNGGEIEKIYLYDLNIKPCMGCNTCEKTRKCVINDDQQGVLDKMGQADAVVFGSPAYWSNVTSEAKKFMDRSAGFFKMTAIGPKRQEGKPSRVVIVTSCGAPYPFSHMMGIIPGVMRAMKVFFCRMNARVSCIYAAGMMNAETSMPSVKLLAKARRLGRALNK
jgi:multimeric flavodoxin WrbA